VHGGMDPVGRQIDRFHSYVPSHAHAAHGQHVPLDPSHHAHGQHGSHRPAHSSHSPRHPASSKDSSYKEVRSFRRSSETGRLEAPYVVCRHSSLSLSLSLSFFLALLLLRLLVFSTRWFESHTHSLSVRLSVSYEH
jgi:hypothetical protein